MIKKPAFSSIFLFSVCLMSIYSWGMNAPKSHEFTWTVEPFGDGGIKVAADHAGASISSPIISQLFDEISTQPFALLKKCQRVRSNFDENTAGYAQFAAENPLFLLSECSDIICPLNRMSNENTCPRHQALDSVGVHVIPALVKNDNLVVVSYAAGELFFDMEMAFYLHQKGITIGKFVIIDPIFEPFVSAVQTKRPMASIISTDLKKELLASEGNHQRKMMEQVRRVEQFLQALNFLNPGVEVFVFRKSCDYNGHWADPFSSPQADMIYAMDYLTLSRKDEDSESDFSFIWARKMNAFGILAKFRGLGGRLHVEISQKIVSKETEKKIDRALTYCQFEDVQRLTLKSIFSTD